ncbi:hypothetical protein MSKU9_0663 [Komagataeibacter diospyri]|uniref:Uncharacterized protein n=1 Tax=Komagataeibacter diospyri TaxID=1932662 RepID=A0A4V0WM58_9PROT|nr:hypothetical protein MSKU9_0663 [Komagataeibacter diospyri]
MVCFWNANTWKQTFLYSMLVNARPLHVAVNLSSRPHLGVIFKGMQNG